MIRVAAVHVKRVHVNLAAALQPILSLDVALSRRRIGDVSQLEHMAHHGSGLAEMEED
jgi:hypothetical protein